MPRLLSKLVLLVLVGVLAGAAPGRALGATRLDVTPAEIDLAGLQGAARITFTNRGKRPIRINLSLLSVTPDADGRDETANSEDLIVFPIRFTLEPGDSRPVRVGFVAVEKSRDVERLYRLVVYERKKGGDAVVRRNVPLRVLPKAITVTPDVVVERQFEDLLFLNLRNRGSVTFGAETVQLRAYPREGEPVVASVTGWYVRPERGHRFAVVLPTSLGCITALDAQVKTLDGRVHDQHLVFEPDACLAPPPPEPEPEQPEEVVVDAPPPLPEGPLPGFIGYFYGFEIPEPPEPEPEGERDDTPYPTTAPDLWTPSSAR